MDRRRYLLLATAALSTAAGCTGGSETDDEPEAQQSGLEISQEETDSLQEETPAQQVEDRSPAVVVGEVASGGTLDMVVEGVERTTTIDEFQEADEGNEFVVVTLAVKNTTEAEYLNFSGFLQTSLKDDQDYSYDQTFAVTDSRFDDGQLVPGEVSRGEVVYEVPEDASGLQLQFDFEAFAFTELERIEVDLTSAAESIATLEQELRVDVHDVGGSVAFEDVVVAVNEVSFTDSLSDFATAEEGMEYAILDVTTENGTDEEQHVSTALQMLVKDGEGNSYDMDFSAQAELDQPYNETQALAPGERRRGQVAYAVPADASPLYWTFEFTLWTDGDKAFWQLR